MFCLPIAMKNAEKSKLGLKNNIVKSSANRINHPIAHISDIDMKDYYQQCMQKKMFCMTRINHYYHFI